MMALGNPEFEKLDRMKKFNWQEDLYLKVKALGYKYVSELVFDWYFNQLKPARQIADALGVVPNSVLSWMQLWGFERRGKGGNNRNPALKNPAMIQRIQTLNGKMNSREAGEIVGCSLPTVRRIWARGIVRAE